MPKATANLTQVKIYTDGSCLGNPGPGGWAARLEAMETIKNFSGGFARTTNNRMELYAAIMGLSALTRSCLVDLYTDSRYLCDAISKGWLYGWKKRNWKKADNKPVLNRDLWEQLYPLLSKHKVTFHWVEGHAGHAENEAVDQLARSAASQNGLPEDAGFGASAVL